jgi:hypothetical protein
MVRISRVLEYRGSAIKSSYIEQRTSLAVKARVVDRVIKPLEL